MQHDTHLPRLSSFGSCLLPERNEVPAEVLLDTKRDLDGHIPGRAISRLRHIRCYIRLVLSLYGGAYQSSTRVFLVFFSLYFLFYILMFIFSYCMCTYLIWLLYTYLHFMGLCTFYVIMYIYFSLYLYRFYHLSLYIHDRYTYITQSLYFMHLYFFILIFKPRLWYGRW